MGKRFLGTLLALVLAAPAPAMAQTRPLTLDLPPSSPSAMTLPAAPAALPQAAASAAPGVTAVPSAPTVMAVQSLEAIDAAAHPAAGQASPSFAERVMDGTNPARPRDDAPRLYVFSKTLDTTVKLGPAARGVHYAREAVWQAVKTAVAYHVGGPAAAAAWWAIYELPTGLLTMSGASLAHLNFLYWLKRRALLKRLALRPGALRLRVISGSAVEFRGLLAYRQNSRALVLAEARQPGDADALLGAPLAVDPDRARLRVGFSFGDSPSPIDWRPTLAEVLARAPIPPEVAAAWREHLSGALSQDGWLKRWFGSVKLRQARMPIALVLPSGEEKSLDDIAQGPAALKLFGASRWARFKAWLGRPAGNRALPLTDKTVARP